MPTRNALLLSIFCALVVSVWTFFVTERFGDPVDRLDSIRKNIRDVQGLLERHSVNLRLLDSSKSTSPERASYIFEDPNGTRFIIDAPKSFTQKQVESATATMISSGRKEFVSVDSAWKEAETWWRGMTWLNRSAAERNTLAAFPMKPDSASSFDWDLRYQDADFTTEETISFNFRRTAYAVAAFAAVFAMLIFSLAMVGWFWRALLARVRELSQAVRGEPPAR